MHRFSVYVDSFVERRAHDRKVAFRYLAGAAGEISSPELTFYAYSVSVPLPCYRSGTEETPVILPKVQVAGYT